MTTFGRILLVPLSAHGLAAFALANTHLCKSSWTDALKEFAEIISLKTMGDFILANAFYNSRAIHVTKVRQILERDPEHDAYSGDFTNQLEKMTEFPVMERTKSYPPAPPSDTLLLPPLKCLYKANVRIQERPRPGDSRPVLPPSHTLSTDHAKLGTLENKHWKV
jgi:hypothetical protein